VIGGSSGIRLETARQAQSEGADVILAGRNPERFEQAARERGARSSAAFDATDFDRLDRLFDELSKPIGHSRVTSLGPYYARPADIDFAQARRKVDGVFRVPLHIARRAVGKVRPGGTLVSNRRHGRAPARRRRTHRGVHRRDTGTHQGARNLIALRFVDTPLSARLGDQLEARREQLGRTLPIGRVVGPADIAVLAVHLMTNTAVTGATSDIDGGQQLVEA
jgi:NAD(P)-dependent dehydrogenase (short-subunit alcohol dehydrogenase family)